MQKHKLISDVVDQGICIGCGVCAGVCPGKNIEMRWSENGELNPYIDQGCLPQSCICIDACPIINAETNFVVEMARLQRPDSQFVPITYPQSHPLVGKYTACYAGYTEKEKEREKSSSGGMLTFLLKELLLTKSVHGIISVVDSDTPSERLFKFDVLRSEEELDRAAGSKYYPVEISDILKFLKKDKSDDVYALVGLPCLLKGVENAVKLLPHLAKKIRYTFSLTCGQLPNRFYTESLAEYSGVSIDELKTVKYRGKEKTLSASNFVFKAFKTSGESGKPLYWMTQPSYLWENSFFIHGACKFCDDVFGRTADAIFMDAWLPQYASDPKGHSFVVVKDIDIDKLVREKAASGLCNAETISIDSIVKSQYDQIEKKTEMLSGHLYMAKKNGMRITKRTVEPSKQHYKHWEKDINLQWETMNQSKLIWKQLKSNGSETTFFENIAPIEKKIARRKKIKYLKQGLLKMGRSPHKTLVRIVDYQVKKLSWL